MASSTPIPPGTVSHAAAKKVHFVACVYIWFLCLCVFFGFVVLAWGITLKLFQHCIIERCTVFKLILSSKLANAAFAFSNWEVWDGYMWLFLVILSLLFEAVLIVGLLVFTTTSDRRNGESVKPMRYLVTLRILIVVFLLLGAAGFLFENYFKKNMTNAMARSVNESALNFTDTVSMRTMDVYQNIFTCCGSKGPNDWVIISTFGKKLDFSPLSCYSDSKCLVVPLNSTSTTMEGSCHSHAVATFASDGGTQNYSIQIQNSNSKFSIHSIKTKTKKTKGCNDAISSDLFIHSLTLILNGLFFLILHFLWHLWKKGFNVSPICCMCCHLPKNNVVHSLGVNEESPKSSQSLIFLKQVALTEKNRRKGNVDEARQPCQATSKMFAATASDKCKPVPDAIKYPKLGTTSSLQDVTKIRFLSEARSEGSQAVGITRVWATNVVTGSTAAGTPKEDELSIYSVESIEW